MHSKKEYLGKIKQLERETKDLCAKNEKLRTELQSVRADRKYLKRRLKAVTAGREDWKAKHKDKQLENKRLKVRLRPSGRIEGHHYPRFLVTLCVLLRIRGGCSYRGIVKILVVLRFCFQLELTRLPCANSVQNWVSKVGLYQLHHTDKELEGQEVSLIIDESIRMGQEKQLLILCVPWEKATPWALKFCDVEVLHIQGAKSWRGETISQVIDALIERHGFVVKNILSDEDSKLKKASRLSEVVHLPDISHAVATCLKKSFGKMPDYKAFTTLVASYQSKGVNQDISYLCPSKQRAKARFMNQQRLVEWAEKMLARFSQLPDKAQGFFAQLGQHQGMIQQLGDALALAKKISLPFKTEGLSAKTLQEAQQILQTQEKQAEINPDFLTHIQAYLTQYQTILQHIGQKTLHASSEIIESFFGKYKQKAHNHPLTGLTRLNLELPLYTMNNQELLRQIPIALQAISMTQIDQWIKEHATESQLLKRTKFFK